MTIEESIQKDPTKFQSVLEENLIKDHIKDKRKDL